MNTISVVISTRKRDDDYFNHVKKAVSHPKSEILMYENDGKMSLPEVYQKALDEAKNDIILFIHDDLIINTTNITPKIIKLFDKFPEYGIIGIAGSTDLIDGVWWNLPKSMVGRVSHTQDGKTWTNKYSEESYIDTLKNVVCVDGLFFMVHRKRIKKGFDLDFKGYHFYDIPFCVSNYLEGVKIGVTTRFNVTHKSIGVTNNQWEENKRLFEEKYKDNLPIRLTNYLTLEDKLNYSKESIGVGMVTYNAPDRIKQSSMTIPQWVKNFVIVNDGTPYDPSVYPPQAHIIQHETNKSVGGAKNTAIDYLLGCECEHIFIIEDDVLIQDENVFDKYIKTSLHSGIKHLNYGLQGPANKKGAKSFNTLEERSKQENLTEPNPRHIVKYNDDIEVALYPNCVGAFSYYQREVLEKIGGFDPYYKNAWEHVDHTLMAFKNKFTTPYWWFADIADSGKYIKDIEGCIENSTISHTETWKENFTKGAEHFRKKHKYTPTQVPDTNPEGLKQILNYLFHNR